MKKITVTLYTTTPPSPQKQKFTLNPQDTIEAWLTSVFDQNTHLTEVERTLTDNNTVITLQTNQNIPHNATLFITVTNQAGITRECLYTTKQAPNQYMALFTPIPDIDYTHNPQTVIEKAKQTIGTLNTMLPVFSHLNAALQEVYNQDLDTKYAVKLKYTYNQEFEEIFNHADAYILPDGTITTQPFTRTMQPGESVTMLYRKTDIFLPDASFPARIESQDLITTMEGLFLSDITTDRIKYLEQNGTNRYNPVKFPNEVELILPKLKRFPSLALRNEQFSLILKTLDIKGVTHIGRAFRCLDNTLNQYHDHNPMTVGANDFPNLLETEEFFLSRVFFGAETITFPKLRKLGGNSIRSNEYTNGITNISLSLPELLETDPSSTSISGDVFSEIHLPKLKKGNIINSTSTTTLDLPELEELYDGITNCNRLTTLNIPKLKIIHRGIYSLPQLTTIDFPLLHTIATSEREDPYGSTFASLGITSLSLPALRTITRTSFYNLENLETISLPELETAKDIISHCPKLTTVSLPKLKDMTSGFNDMAVLTTITLPKLETAKLCFLNCPKLQSVNLPMIKNIYRDLGDLKPDTSYSYSTYSFKSSPELTTVTLGQGGDGIIALGLCNATNITVQPGFWSTLSLHGCANISKTTFLDILSNLRDMTQPDAPQPTTGQRTIYINQTLARELTQNEIAPAIAKGWTIDTDGITLPTLTTDR